MASVEEAVIAKLLATASITAITGQRIRPTSKAQPDATPFSLVQKTAGEEMPTHDGSGEYEKATIQIDSFGKTGAQAVQLARAIRAGLHMKQFTAAGVFVAVCRHQETGDATPPTQPGEEIPVFIQSSEFSVLYREVATP